METILNLALGFFLGGIHPDSVGNTIQVSDS
jgi:hypothetical protein